MRHNHKQYPVTLALKDRDTDACKVFKCWIVVCGSSCWIGAITFWHEDYHALTSTSKQNAVRVPEVLAALWFVNRIPFATHKRVVIPIWVCEPEVRIPCYTDPVEFEALHLKLGGSVFHVKTRSRIFAVVQEPMNGIYLDTDVDGVGFEALSSRGGDQAKTL